MTNCNYFLLSTPDIIQNSSSSISQASLTDAWKSWNDVAPAVLPLCVVRTSLLGEGLKVLRYVFIFYKVAKLQYLPGTVLLFFFQKDALSPSLFRTPSIMHTQIPYFTKLYDLQLHFLVNCKQEHQNFEVIFIDERMNGSVCSATLTSNNTMIIIYIIHPCLAMTIIACKSRKEISILFLNMYYC